MALYKNSSFLDSLVVFNLCFLAAIPFHQVLHLEIGFAIFNLGELLLIFLLLIFIIILVLRGIVKKYAPYVLFVFMVFVLYLVLSVLLLDVGLGRIINQARFFLPFIVACAALLSRLHIDKAYFIREIA
jgi:hypothetical protein